MKSNLSFNLSNSIYTLEIELASNTPNPSSMAMKFGLAKDVTSINATLEATDTKNLSIPDAN